MKNKFDVLIIGGGPGGLTIGALLAKEGISSAIIEKEPDLGGRYRSVNFHGCHSDNGVRMPTAMKRKPKDTFMYKYLDYMGIAPQATKVINWTMGMVKKDSRDRVEYFAMDPNKGVDNFFEFFAFGSGLPMEKPSRQALMQAFHIMEDTSEEECRKLVNVTFSSWIERNIDDPVAKAVLELAAPLMGAPTNVVNLGQFSNIFGTFPKVGALLFWYPSQGTMQDMVIDPLNRYYQKHGGTILTNRRARSVLIENKKAKGVIADNTETHFLEEYSAPVVICAIPIFDAMARNILRREFLTRDWAKGIEQCGKLAYEDLSVFYLLREGVFPEKTPGWVHIFDPDYGLPTYVGDWCLGSLFNVKEPAGKQYLYSYIPGGLPDTPFGLSSPPEVVNEAIRRWEAAVEKAFPGFNKAIQFKGRSLQLNWGRYAWAVVPTEIDLQSPNIKGLYFAGDTVWSVSSMVSDKIYQMVFPLFEKIKKYLRS
jgi:phytoene dehydrogenase-like protein